MSDVSYWISRKPEKRPPARRPFRLFVPYWTITYIGVIVLANLMLKWLPMVSAFGTDFPPAILASGFVFVLRDFVQREIKRFVFLPIAIAAAITWVLTDERIAAASTIAFATAEIADTLIYTWTKRRLSDRVLISSLISVPVDTAVFYWALNILDPASFALGVGIKLVAAVLFWAWLRSRGQ